MTPGFDSRLTPARSDLAAAYLEGRVQADRFVAGDRRVIAAEIADLKRRPRPDAPLETQAIHGEAVTVYEIDEEGWAWVQLEADGYVGYLAIQALDRVKAEATHVVGVNRTFVYPAADMKRPILAALPIGARIVVEKIEDGFARLIDGGYVFAAHLALTDTLEADFVHVAERLVATPYLWGGKSSLGIDCSGLVQVSLNRAGVNVPRDTDLQEAAIGVCVDPWRGELRRGDLIFWNGHVGIMRDGLDLIHANAHHMQVAVEPLADAVARIHAATSNTIRTVRRISAP